MSKRRVFSTIVTAAVFGLYGCGGSTTYRPPGRGANLSSLGNDRAAQTEVGVGAALDRKPLASFPTSLAVVRIQGSGYSGQGSYGQGAYSVMTTRDVEQDADFERLAKLPLVNAVFPISRLLLPETMQSDRDLRQAAARLNADILMVYTLDTQFYDQDMAAGLSVITLGISPNKHVSVTTTASALLMDSRNGYIYGAIEATEKRDELANAWGTEAAIDRCRRQNESAAFKKLVQQTETTWAGVIKNYAPAGATTKPG